MRRSLLEHSHAHPPPKHSRAAERTKEKKRRHSQSETIAAGIGGLVGVDQMALELWLLRFAGLLSRRPAQQAMISDELVQANKQPIWSLPTV